MEMNRFALIQNVTFRSPPTNKKSTFSVVGLGKHYVIVTKINICMYTHIDIYYNYNKMLLKPVFPNNIVCRDV